MTDELTVRGLITGHIAHIPVLHGIDFAVRAGEVIGIMGRNGAGKSSLTAAIIGVLRVWSGQVILNGWDCTQAPSTERVRRGLVAVPENRRLFGELTVLENLRVAAFGAKKEFTVARREEIEAEFPVLVSKANTKCSVLSGGEQQMVALARARVMEPKFLLLDEPSLGLSPAMTSELAKAIRRFSTSGVGVVLIEQNMALVEKVCDRVRLLDNGRFVRDVNISDISGREEIVTTYLGTNISVIQESASELAPRIDDDAPRIAAEK